MAWIPRLPRETEITEAQFDDAFRYGDDGSFADLVEELMVADGIRAEAAARSARLALGFDSASKLPQLLDVYRAVSR
ncbi:hypothetical protein ACIRVK_35525 [Streptomyces sp. NPDC101152]|uniref:hypothetical protein n=1 Tax=Streptomyces sp. NPDC101152 TaxID=3366116 RepID=UPI00381593D9